MKASRIFLFACAALLLPVLLLLTSCGGKDATETTAEPSEYTVTFSVNGVETKATVPAGETPAYTGETSWETAEHFYKIIGWEPALAPATSDVTYTASVGEYGLTLYRVRFNMPDGTFPTVETHEGEMPTPPAGYETDCVKNPGMVGYFDHWVPEMVAPTAENMEGKKVVVYTPVYNYETATYTITFHVNGTSYEVETEGKTIPVCPVDPTEYEDSANKFAGWDKKLAPAVKDETYTAFYGGTAGAEIAPAKDGAISILTVTDDRERDNARWMLTQFRKYGLRGSCMLIAGRLDSGRVAEWKEIFSDGTLEPGCLSMSHTPDTIEGPQSLYQNEIVNSKLLLERLFPGSNIICFGSPYAQLRDFSYQTDASGNVVEKNGSPVKVYDGGSKKLARETYYAIRNGTSGLNTLDPGCTDDAGGWYNLKVQWTLNSQTSAQRLSWIDDAVKNKGWLLILAHTFSDGPSDDTYAIPKTEAVEFFARASGYVESGELWSATFVEATKYLREKQSATAYRRMEDGVLYVGLKLDRETPDGKPLDESIFNYPLTVKARVPSAWNSVSYELNGETVTANVQTDPANNQKYVLVNIVPGEDGAVSSVRVERAD